MTFAFFKNFLGINSIFKPDLILKLYLKPLIFNRIYSLVFMQFWSLKMGKMEKRRKTKGFSNLIKKLTKAAKARKTSNETLLKKYSDNASAKVDEGISKIIANNIVPQ